MKCRIAVINVPIDLMDCTISAIWQLRTEEWSLCASPFPLLSLPPPWRYAFPISLS